MPATPQYFNFTLSTHSTSTRLEALPACDQTSLLLSFRASFRDGSALLPSWVGSPCGAEGWAGVSCDASGQVVSM